MADAQVLQALASEFPQINLAKDIQLMRCPFHGDETPSMAVYLTKGDEHVHCYSCGRHQGIVRFLAELHGVTVREKLQELGLLLDDRVQALETIVDAFADQLENGETILTNAEHRIAGEFLSEVRGHDIALLRRKRIGVATQEAVDMIELTIDSESLQKLRLLDKSGKLIIPIGAITIPVVLGGEPVGLRWKRYAGDAEHPKEIGQMRREGWIRFSNIYNYDFLMAEVDDLWIVEGEDDAWRLEAAGATVTTFLGGCSPRDKRLERLKFSPAKRFIIGTDNDEAGKKYAENLSNWCRKNKRDCGIYIPEANDVAEDLDKYSLPDMEKKVEASGYGLREINNAYWENSTRLSNFTLELRAKIIGDEEIFLVLELIGEKEPEPRTLIIPNRLVGDKAAFNQFVKREGCFTWLGPGVSLDELVTEKWSQDLPVHYAIDYVGKVDLGEYEKGNPDHVFVMPDRMFTRDGSDTGSDNGVFWISDNRGLFLEIPEGITKPSGGIMPEETRIQELIETMWTDEYLIALGWFIAIPWALEVQKRLGGFPMLWLSGERGSGKTTFASFLMGLFSPLAQLKDTTSAFLSAAGTTPEGLSRALARFSCMPVLFDDLRTNTRWIAGFMEMMRALYDKYSIQKGKINVRDSMRKAFEMRKMRASLVVTSQHHPEDDALSQRVLELHFKKKHLNANVLEKFRALVKELFPIGLSLQLRSLNERFDEIDPAMGILGSQAISDRRLQAFAVSCAGLLKIGVSIEKVRDIAKRFVITIDRTAQESDEVNDFMERLRVLLTYHPGELRSYVGSKEGVGTWIAPSYLYQLLIRYTKGDLPYTSRSIKSLLKAQKGVISFSGDYERVVSTKIGEKWTSVRAVFFQFGCEMAKQIRMLVRSSQPDIEQEIMGLSEGEFGFETEDAEAQPDQPVEPEQHELDDIL